MRFFARSDRISTGRSPRVRGATRWSTTPRSWSRHLSASETIRGEYALIPVAMKVLGRRRAPHGRLAGRPHLGPLRLVVMPGARLEVAELLVEHLIHFAEEFDHVVVVIAVVGRDVVAGSVAQRSPDDRD